MADFSSEFNMHLRIKGFARLTIALGADGTVKLLWRVREGEIYEPAVQEVRFLDGRWMAGPPGVTTTYRSDEPEIAGFG